MQRIPRNFHARVDQDIKMSVCTPRCEGAKAGGDVNGVYSFSNPRRHRRQAKLRLDIIA